MTPLELRIKYRFETGLAPTYGKDERGYNYRGGLTQEYAEWLEQYQFDNTVPVSMLWQRELFKNDTGMDATIYDKHQNLKFVRSYKLWLEELLCETLSIFEQ